MATNDSYDATALATITATAGEPLWLSFLIGQIKLSRSDLWTSSDLGKSWQPLPPSNIQDSSGQILIADDAAIYSGKAIAIGMNLTALSDTDLKFYAEASLLGAHQAPIANSAMTLKGTAKKPVIYLWATWMLQ